MIIAYVGIVVLTTYLGYAYAKGYAIKNKIYKQLYDFLIYYKLEIGYSQKKLIEILRNFTKNEKKDLINLNEFLNYLDREYLNLDKFTFKNEIKYICESEQKEIEAIFNELGKYDLTQEKEKIELLINQINQKVVETLEEKNKYYNLSIKIGIIIGCFVDVLLI
ncbi:MAG: stage III sporulation protein AB [Christensenellales bacterium]